MKKDGDGREAKGNQQCMHDVYQKKSAYSESDAHDLVKLVGTDWNSLFGEARFLKERH